MLLSLAIDTINQPTQVTLSHDGQIISQKTLPIDCHIAQTALLAIDELLAKNHHGPSDINRITVCAGPSRHSSAARLGAVIASLLAYATGAEVTFAKPY